MPAPSAHISRCMWLRGFACLRAARIILACSSCSAAMPPSAGSARSAGAIACSGRRRPGWKLRHLVLAAFCAIGQSCISMFYLLLPELNIQLP